MAFLLTCRVLIYIYIYMRISHFWVCFVLIVGSFQSGALTTLKTTRYPVEMSNTMWPKIGPIGNWERWWCLLGTYFCCPKKWKPQKIHIFNPGLLDSHLGIMHVSLVVKDIIFMVDLGERVASTLKRQDPMEDFSQGLDETGLLFTNCSKHSFKML